jgi:hypothetical protein
MRKFPLQVILAVAIVLVLASGMWIARSASGQNAYRTYFRSRDICFELSIEGASGGYRWYTAVRCSTGDELSILYGTPTARLNFVDVDADGTPEIYISGESPSYPGENLYRYSEEEEDETRRFTVMTDVPEHILERLAERWN